MRVLEPASTASISASSSGSCTERRPLFSITSMRVPLPSSRRSKQRRDLELPFAIPFGRLGGDVSDIRIAAEQRPLALAELQGGDLCRRGAGPVARQRADAGGIGRVV